MTRAKARSPPMTADEIRELSKNVADSIDLSAIIESVKK
jgi:hypothetical protein